MKQIEVTERAADIIEALRDEHYSLLCKSRICDVMCNVIDRAEENHTFAEDLKLLTVLSEVADAINELSHSAKS